MSRTRVTGELTLSMTSSGVVGMTQPTQIPGGWPLLGHSLQLIRRPLEFLRYGSCRSLPWCLIGVGVPSLVGLPGAVLVAASPRRPGIAVRFVAAGFGDDGAAKLSEQLRYGNGDQFEHARAAVRGALAGGGHGEERAGEQADRRPAVPGGPGGDLAADFSSAVSSTISTTSSSSWPAVRCPAAQSAPASSICRSSTRARDSRCCMRYGLACPAASASVQQL
jgi:hypothetical protein